MYNAIKELRLKVSHALREYPELHDDEDLKIDTLEGLTDIKEILALVVQRALEARSMVAAIQVRAKMLDERKSRFQRQDAFWTEVLFDILQTAETNKVELPEATISIAKGRQGVVIHDPDQIPERFLRIKKEPNKTAILEALKAGEPVLGCSPSNPKPTLRIKTK